MADIFSELDDDLRDEKLQEFWKEYGTWIISMIILAVLTTASVSIWRGMKISSETKNTAALIKTLYQDDVDQLVNYAEQASTNHAVIAEFMAGALFVEKGEYAKALGVYKKISETSGVDKSYKDLAVLRAISLEIGTVDTAILEKKLSAFDKENHAWRFMALELKALNYAQAQNFDKALSVLETVLSKKNVPYALVRRMQMLKGLYLIQLQQMKKKAEGGVK